MCYNNSLFPPYRNIAKLRNMLSVSDVEKLVHAFMTSRLDYSCEEATQRRRYIMP